MAIARWNPPVELTKREELIARRLGRVRKFFPFLRRHRHELFDEAFQTELAAMYRDTGAGSAPVPPPKLAMPPLLAVTGRLKNWPGSRPLRGRSAPSAPMGASAW